MSVGKIRRPAFAAKLALQRYPDLCTIQRQDLVDDNRGGQTPDNAASPWPTLLDGDEEPIVFRCQVNATRQKPSERFENERLTSEGEYDVSLEKSVDIRNTDRITVSTLDNRVFYIIGPRFAADQVSQIMAASEIV